MTIPTVTCPKCAHGWTPRLPNPRVCPKCKRYLTDQKPADEGKEEQLCRA